MSIHVTVLCWPLFVVDDISLGDVRSARLIMMCMFHDRIWGRFLMSFLINGIGYHVLVHALPLQGAQQSSLTSFVLRSVGMIYLVDLDDTPGYKLTIVVPPPPPPKEVMMDEFETKKLMSEQEPPPPPQQQEPFTKTETAPPAAPSTSTGSPSSNNSSSNNREEEISKAALEIIEDAKRKLDALLRGGTGGSNGGEPLATADSSTTNFKGTSRNLLLGVYPTATTTTTTTTSTNPTPPSQQQPQAEQQPQYVDPNPLMPVALTAMMASGEYDGNNNDDEEAVDA